MQKRASVLLNNRCAQLASLGACVLGRFMDVTDEVLNEFVQKRAMRSVAEVDDTSGQGFEHVQSEVHLGTGGAEVRRRKSVSGDVS